MALTPGELSGHALGLHSSGMLTMQGVGAAIAGVVAQRTSPGAAMAVMAAASVAVTLILAPGLRSRKKDGPIPGRPEADGTSGCQVSGQAGAARSVGGSGRSSAP